METTDNRYVNDELDAIIDSILSYPAYKEPFQISDEIKERLTGLYQSIKDASIMDYTDKTSLYKSLERVKEMVGNNMLKRLIDGAIRKIEVEPDFNSAEVLFEYNNALFMILPYTYEDDTY